MLVGLLLVKKATRKKPVTIFLGGALQLKILKKFASQQQALRSQQFFLSRISISC
jgi:hypothetical protein